MWRRRREAASARLSAAPYSAHHKLYSEAVVSSVVSAVALAEAGQFKEAVQYVQKAAKTLYETAKEVFERVKATAQRLVELFVEAFARALAWVDEHKAHLFLMAAVAAGAVALSAALNMWGLVELEKLAHFAMGMTPFIPGDVKKYSREEVFNILKNAPDPYEKFKELAKKANAGKIKLAQPWESLRLLILPKRSEEKRLGKAYGELDEGKKKALFYAVLALEETFGVYRSASRKYAEGLKKAVQSVEMGEGPFKKDMYVADLKQIKQLTEKESKTFENALSTLRKRLNEYAVKYGLGGLLNVEEGKAKELAEAEVPELPEFSGVSFGVKALAALIAYREYALGRRGAFGTAARYWLEEGGSAWLLYYTPKTAYNKAIRAKVERPAEVGEMVAEAFRRLFLKPGADRYRGFVELLRSGKLALMLEETKTSYVFRLFRLEGGGGPVDLGIKLWISKVGEGERAGITYALTFDNVERWWGFFGQEIQAGVKAAEVVGRCLPVEDRFPYMAGWVNSDVAISGGLLEMSTSHLWQLAETHALFGWSDIVVFRVNLTLEGPKPQFYAHTSLEKLDETIKRSAEGGWLRMLGVEAGLEDLMHVKSWEGLKQWVAENWDVVVDAAVKRLGEEVRGELKALRVRLNDDKTAREVVAPALLLMQAERLGVNKATLRYLGAVISGAIDGDGYVSAAMRVVGLTSGKREIALLWVAALAAHGIKAEVRWARSAFNVTASDDDAIKLAGLYFLYGPPLLEGDEKVINHKLAEAVKLGVEGLSVSWEGLRRTPSGLVAADLTISGGGAAVNYNVYLHGDTIVLDFQSADRSRAELAARLLRLAGVSAEVKKAGNRGMWRVEATTDKLAAGRKELRDAIAKIVEAARDNGWVDAGKAERWLKKLKSGRVLKEGWLKYLVRSKDGRLKVRFASPNPVSIEREAQRLENMGLTRGVHFSVKVPEGGGKGYVSILKEGLAYAAWLSVHGEGKQQKLAAEFVEYILQRAREACGSAERCAVYEKAKEIVEKGKEMRSQTLEGFEKWVEVNGKTYVVKVRGGKAVEEDRGGKPLLRIKITAEVGRVEGEHIVDRVVREYTITFGRYGDDNETRGFAYAWADAPGGRETDAERLAAVIEALTGVKPKVYRRSDGDIEIICGRTHLEGFMRYTELADAIEKWLEETRR